MRVCIPTVDDTGMSAAPHTHFGSAPFFTLVDTESGSCEVIRNTDHGHGEGSCEPLRALESSRLDAVICRGMGRRALAAMRSTGIDVYVTDGDSVERMITAARMGELKLLSDLEACHGGGRHHGTRR